MYLLISIGPPCVLKVGGLTGGDAVGGMSLLILVKNVLIVLVLYSIDR